MSWVQEQTHTHTHTLCGPGSNRRVFGRHWELGSISEGQKICWNCQFFTETPEAHTHTHARTHTHAHAHRTIHLHADFSHSAHSKQTPFWMETCGALKLVCTVHSVYIHPRRPPAVVTCSLRASLFDVLVVVIVVIFSGQSRQRLRSRLDPRISGVLTSRLPAH